MLQFKLTSEDEAILSYPCSNDIVVSQFARRQQRHREVELWAASDLPVEQRYQLSRSKCRASLIYLGPAHATIKFPCALVHLTVTCDIVSTETLDEMTVIQLQPTKALITFSGGIQEFRFEEDILIPLGPFKPFKSPEPSLPVTLKKDNRKCELCEQRCKVNRLKGETGVYRVTLPVVASATLHPAPPEGFTVFIAGCNFKCLHCQNWTISQYPDNNCK